MVCYPNITEYAVRSTESGMKFEGVNTSHHYLNRDSTVGSQTLIAISDAGHTRDSGADGSLLRPAEWNMLTPNLAAGPTSPDPGASAIGRQL